jgi:hypothetical protein
MRGTYQSGDDFTNSPLFGEILRRHRREKHLDTAENMLYLLRSRPEAGLIVPGESTDLTKSSTLPDLDGACRATCPVPERDEGNG